LPEAEAGRPDSDCAFASMTPSQCCGRSTGAGAGSTSAGAGSTGAGAGSTRAAWGEEEALTGWKTRAEAFDFEVRDKSALAAEYRRGRARRILLAPS